MVAPIQLPPASSLVDATGLIINAITNLIRCFLKYYGTIDPMKPKLLPLVHVAIFASAISAQAAEFKFATQTLTVPDGFTIELIAGPPLVNRPISIAFDEQGHLYATDSAGMSDKA